MNGGFATLERPVNGIARIARSNGALAFSGDEVIPVDSAGKLGAALPGPELTTTSTIERFADGKLLLGGRVISILEPSGAIAKTIPRDTFTIPLNALAPGTNGAIYGAGTKPAGSKPDGTPRARFSVQKLTSAGTVDTTFGDGGIALSKMIDRLQVEGIAVAEDGSIWVRGSFAFGKPLVAKFTPQGAPAPGFGSEGVVTLPELGARLSREMTLTEDGGAFVLGMKGSSPQIAKLLADGKRDLTFGSNGLATFFVTKPLASPYDEQVESRTLLVAEDGKLLIVSSYERDEGEDEILEEESLVVLRALPTGELDKGFGTDGVVRVMLGAPSRPSKAWSTKSAVLLGDKRLLIGGTTYARRGSKGATSGGLVCLAL